MDSINTANDFLVGVRGDLIQPVLPIGPMTKEKAIRLAGWLVALADFSKDHSDFKAVLAAIERT